MVYTAYLTLSIVCPTIILARDAQAKLALIVAQCLSICVSVRDSLSHAYVRSIARREPRRLPASIHFYFASLQHAHAISSAGYTFILCVPYGLLTHKEKNV